MLLFVAYGLVSLENSLSRSFPQAQLQQHLVHISCNLEHHVRLKDWATVLQDCKQIHQAYNKTAATAALQSFIQTWQDRYPQLTAKLVHNEYLLVCCNFSRAIRASIYLQY